VGVAGVLLIWLRNFLTPAEHAAGFVFGTLLSFVGSNARANYFFSGGSIRAKSEFDP
jgi:hypothetical protein